MFLFSPPLTVYCVLHDMLATRQVQFALYVGFAAFCIVLGAIAIRLPLDYWDAFEFLTNAVLISGHSESVSSHYFWSRPPLWSLLMAPLHWDHARAGVSLWKPHLLGVATAAGALWMANRLFQRSFSRAIALLGLCALAVNRLSIHYAPFALADFLTMLVTLWGLETWLNAARQRTFRAYAVAGIAVGVAISTKYPLLVFPVGLVLFELSELFRRSDSSLALNFVRRAARVVTAGMTSALVAVVIAGLAVGFAHRGLRLSDLSYGFSQILVNARQPGLDDPWWEYFQTLWILVGPAWLALATWGIVCALKRRSDEDWLHLFWVVVYLVPMSAVIKHREARYVFPILPSLIWFALLGVEQLKPRIRERWMQGVAVIALLAVPIHGGISELLQFQRTIYRQPLLSEIANYVHSRPYLMVGGRAWSVFLPDPKPFPHEEFMHFHHLSPVAFEYMAGKPQTPSAAQIYLQLPGTWYDGMVAPPLPSLPDPVIATDALSRQAQVFRFQESN